MLADPVAREGDEPLDERSGGAALLERALGDLEDDDVPALRIAEAMDEPVGEPLSDASAWQPTSGVAQWSVGSIEDDGIRYGFTTHALMASTAATAIVIVRPSRRPCPTRRERPRDPFERPSTEPTAPCSARGASAR